MNNTTMIKKKIFALETNLEFIKKTLLQEPDFEVDEKNWNKVRPLVKKVRKNLYRMRYEEK